MDFFINGYNIFLVLLTTFLASVFLTPFIKRLAFKVGATDKPDNKRKIHNELMPTMGGLAMFISFLIGFILFAPKTNQMYAALIASFVIIVVGIIDDIKSLPVKVKLLGQILAASIAVFAGSITFQNMQIFGIQFNFGIMAYPISILFIVAIINAINFADGLDGLAAGTSTIYFITVAILGYIMKKLAGLDVILCMIMIGACLGFLIYNFHPAQIFMGDTGSMFLGLIISIIALLGFKTATMTSLIIPLLLLFVPIFDTILAMARRIMKGQSIGVADKEHLHHQLLKRTKSTTKTVIIMYLINILFAAVSILYTLGNKKFSMVIYIVLLILFIVLVLKTDILLEHNDKEGE